MDNVLRISEAASLALHAMAFLSTNRDRQVPAPEIAAELRASEAHLSKVLQRLTKVGLVRPHRGRNGGYTLAGGKANPTLLDVYEAIEGPLTPTECLLGKPICGGKRCILGGLVGKLNREVRDYLAKTRLSDLRNVFRSHHHGEKKDHQDRRGKVQRVRAVR